MAGLNAARRAQGLEPVVFPRTSSYIGTLVDDLVTKVGTPVFLTVPTYDCMLLQIQLYLNADIQQTFAEFLRASEAQHGLRHIVRWRANGCYNRLNTALTAVLEMLPLWEER